MTSALTGTLLAKRLFGDWALGDFKTDTGIVKVVGQVVTALEQNKQYELTGRSTVHPKHGDRFEVAGATPYLALNRQAIIHYLVRNFTGIGDVTAARIVATYEGDTSLNALHQLLIERPWDLNGADFGQGKHRIAYKDGDRDSAGGYLHRLLAARHLGQGVPDAVLRRLAIALIAQFEGRDNPVGRAVAAFEKDPYQAIATVPGYGFQYADTMAKVCGIDPNSPVRLAALLYNTLRTSIESEGHTFLPDFALQELIERIDPSIHFALAATYLVQRDYPVVRDDKNRFYLWNLKRLEDDVARMLYPMLLPGKPIRPSCDPATLAREIAEVERQMATKAPLDAAQRHGIVGLLTSDKQLHTLTAPPGCGKTTVLEIFAQLVQGEVAFCAPTGKASKVLLARVKPYGFASTTIHQLLEPSLEGFMRNAEDPLDADVVVVDEASMVDLSLIWHLLDALKPSAHLILVGDWDQLASVGPGNVLANILKMHADHHALDKTYRNGGEILKLIHNVRKGLFVAPPADAADVRYFDRLDLSNESFAQVEAEYLAAIKRVGLSQAVLLIANRKGNKATQGWNVTYLNARLQDIINPGGEPVRGTQFRIGDRVIIRKNMVIPGDEGAAPFNVVNGDVGTITAVEETKAHVVRRLFLSLDDGRRVGIPPELSEFLALAYALTVHASQGSEYLEVVVAIRKGGASFMNRKVLYTAISRARARLTLFGEPDVLASIAKRPGGIRFSALVDKVTNYKP